MQCTAIKGGVRCRKHAMKGKDVCEKHGGKTPSGKDSPHWRHGRYSKVLPAALQTAYERSLNNPYLHSLDDYIALGDAQISRLLKQEEINWDEVIKLQDHQRKLIKAEADRLRLAGMFVEMSEIMGYIRRIKEAVQHNVPSETYEKIAWEVAQTDGDFEARILLLEQQAIDGDEEDSEVEDE